MIESEYQHAFREVYAALADHKPTILASTYPWMNEVVCQCGATLVVPGSMPAFEEMQELPVQHKPHCVMSILAKHRDLFEAVKRIRS